MPRSRSRSRSPHHRDRTRERREHGSRDGDRRRRRSGSADRERHGGVRSRSRSGDRERREGARSRSRSRHRSSHHHRRRHDKRRQSEDSEEARAAVAGAAAAVVVASAPAPGVVPIDGDCLGEHARGFSAWLASVGRPPLTDLPKADARALFEKMYVPAWNADRLSPAVKAAQAGGGAPLRSAHTWGFALSAADAERLAAASEDVAAAEVARRPAPASSAAGAGRMVGPARPPGR